ncbi:helix-turn-helix transcriptional regulator, partial [Salmonella sp. SAL4444]|uniref:helix-turn-helix transcriptional regulator n=1 Tax=Salmonella sp. SAL4444 TaxID=3159899 RepID=UPI00397E5145
MNPSQTCEREGVAKARLESLLNEYEVAGISRLSVATIRRRRFLGLPPRYIKIGASVRYRPHDVECW